MILMTIMKVVRPVWSKNKLRHWMVYSAMAYAWISAIIYNLILVMLTSTVVVDVECWPW